MNGEARQSQHIKMKSSVVRRAREVPGDSYERRDLMIKGNDKVVSLPEAIKFVKSGMTIFVDGFGYNRAPMAAIHELIRQGAKELTLIGVTELQGDILIAAGVVSRLDHGWTGAEGWPHGSFSSYPMRRAIEKGELEVEHYSNVAIEYRLVGGAYGWPFVPCTGFQASDLFRYEMSRGKDRAALITCPFTGEDVALLPTINPDVTITHVQRADPRGNMQIEGQLAMIREAIMAAKTTIITCEEIIPTDFIRRDPHKTVIPDLMVDYVVEVPWGAYPTACPYYYDYDWEHIQLYFNASREEESSRKYLDEYVYGVKSCNEFLGKVLTPEKSAKLKASSYLGY